ncbi:DENN domain-containing protein 1B isoform X1 [Acipenser oxyrinchus oxyrinchus]|uniref:DENN domain-containing protein 1B isoform X1 n=1 Tax=Acipenser oxyrinchus oxyrinchus TaxID=40147 RepID=A0AAD8D832_ACIOX|nr:DENN domain-containing protein 1B isoform X1 [Acipenser oxyrinchus oxyrinchus]
MDSRINENPARTFDLVLQVECPTSENKDPAVLWKFPKDFGDQEVLQTVPKFCFPFDVERVSQKQVGQHFTFVLTDIDGKQRFGFCRLTSGCKVCLCILSYLPWFEIYYKLLNTLADNFTNQQENDLNDMLESLYSYPVPKPNTSVNLSVNEQLFFATGQALKDQQSQLPHSYFITPDINGLPTIPESRNLTEYFVAVDVNNMLQLYASMMHERRIIITSSKLSTLTACVHGSTALLYPLFWQHIYIPVLPPHLLDYCCAPMPYVVGVHLSLLEKVKSRTLEDVVILNVDTNTLETPFDDLQNLPSDVMSTLKSKLKKQSTATGSGVAMAFLRTQAALFGSYRDDLRYKPGEPISFCEDSFINHRSSTMRAFLKMAVNLQLFKQFIDGRLARINAGKGFSDVFEEEITEGGFCGANSRSYQQWMQPVKKGGAMINTAVTKASPAVKTAYKFAKSHAKQGLKEMKSMLKQKETDEEDGQVSMGSPTSTKSLSPKRKQGQRQRKFHRPNTSMGCADFVLDDDEMDTASKLSSEDSGEVSACIEDSDDSCEMDSDKQYTGKMDLLGEILDTLSINSSDQGKLSGAKSLDFLRSMDDIDYKAVNKSNTPSEISLPQLSMSGSEHTGWNLGQDDSMLHGKHLPPSPRRQNCGGPGDTLYIVTEEHSPIPHGLHKKDLSKITVNSAPPVGSQNAPAQADRSSVVQRNKLPKQTLKCSPEGTFQEQNPKKKGRQPSVLVPWEKEDIEEVLKTETEEKGLLEEIESMYCISSAFNAGLNISYPGENA